MYTSVSEALFEQKESKEAKQKRRGCLGKTGSCCFLVFKVALVLVYQ